MTPRIDALLAGERRRQRGRLLLAGAAAAAVGGGSVLLLGLSGWFITATSVAGLAGAASASAFNALLPSAGIRLLAILRTGGRYAERINGHDAALRALGRVRPALFRAFAASPPALALTMSVGEATARMVQDVGELEVALVQRSSAWAAGAAGVAGFTLASLAGGPALAIVAFAVAAVLVGARLLTAAMERQGAAVPTANGRLKEETAAMLAAAPELRAYGLEEWAAERVAGKSAALLEAQRRLTGAGGRFDLLLATAAGLAAMLTLVAARDATLPVAAMAALGTSMTIDGLAGALRTMQQGGRVRAAKRRLEAIIGPAAGGASPLTATVAPSLALAGTTLLPGTVAGLTGPSGCGKTTLIETLAELRPAAPGLVSLGGVDLASLAPAAARRCFAVAAQDAALLAGTVRENLVLADPGVSEAAIWEALHDAALDARVRALPDGLDTWLGENGARLSGGERRRLVLARAYLRAAPWLLLDEPTEGLDAATESVVVERLHERLLRRGQGALIVSHRPAPLGLCDVLFETSAFGVLTYTDILRSAA